MFELVQELYENAFRREHSIYLRDLFKINPNGVDYHNPNNLGFEFKESFMEKKPNTFFKVPKHQIEQSDFFVFCFHSIEYFLVDKRKIAERFLCENKTKQANIRINTIRGLSMFNTFDVNILKAYIDTITGD